MLDTLTSGSKGLSLLISPINTLDGLVFWLFGATPEFDSSLGRADLDGYVYLLGCLAYIAVGAGWLFRRYQRLAV